MEPTTADEAPSKPPRLHGKRLPSAIVAGGAAVAMILAGLGIAEAQTDDPTTTTPPSSSAPGDADGRHRHGPGHTHADHHPHARLTVAAEALGMTTADLRAELLAGKSIAQVAEAEGVAVSAVVDALVADRTEVLDAAVEDGRITREQADARIATLPERMQALVERTRPADGERRHRKGPAGHGVRMQAKLDAAATALGITVEELRGELRAGTSLATIAGERNVPIGQVVSALVADARARLAQAVADGQLTQAQADERSANLDARITDLVNRTPRTGAKAHQAPEAEAEAEPSSVPA